jgi:predicted dehydrogenase
MTATPPPLRWALVGTGNVAARFGLDLQLSDLHELVTVYSRTADRGAAFAARVQAPTWHTDLDEMLARDDVDAVYIAVPHPLHHELAAAAIDAGKAVLLEKPFTVTAVEARDLVQRAATRGVFLMEAMWTRFLPHMVQIRRLLEAGRLGDIRMVTAEHGVWFAHNPAHRMFDAALGGGALLDLAVYPISFASMVLGTPRSVTAGATFTDTGVDAQTVVVLDHDGGRRAVTTSSMQAWMANRAVIAGDAARLEIDRSWLHPSSFTVTDRDGHTERHEFPIEGTGYRFQADEVARGVRAGKLDSDVMSLAETCAVMDTLDTAREQIGLRLPGYPVADEAGQEK